MTDYKQKVLETAYLPIGTSKYLQYAGGHITRLYCCGCSNQAPCSAHTQYVASFFCLPLAKLWIKTDTVKLPPTAIFSRLQMIPSVSPPHNPYGSNFPRQIKTASENFSMTTTVPSCYTKRRSEVVFQLSKCT